MCDLLLERGANVNAADLLGRTALHMAARCTCLEAMSVLLQNGADVNAQDKETQTCLMAAISKAPFCHTYTIHNHVKRLSESDPLTHRSAN